MLVSQGYTSNAGNTYFKGIRLSERIYITFDIGIGYLYTFLNGITIYANSESERKIIGSRSYYNNIYSEIQIKQDAKDILFEELGKEMKNSGLNFDDQQITDFVDKIVEDAYKNQIETLKNIHLYKLLSL